MSNNRQWIPLNEPISHYMNEAEISNSKYFKLFNIAIRGMDELGLDFFYSVRSVKLPVNANLTVNLPADYIQYSKVGVLNDGGQIIPLAVNNNLTSAFDLMPTRIQQTQDDTIISAYIPNGIVWWNYYNGYGMTTLYGLPSGAPFVGQFKIDNDNGVIILSEDFSYPYIMLEYIPSPDPNETYMIPIQFREALIAYLAWMDIRSISVGGRHANLGEKRDRRSEFYNQRRLAIARYDPVNLPDLYEWSLRNQRIAVKS